MNINLTERIRSVTSGPLFKSSSNIQQITPKVASKLNLEQVRDQDAERRRLTMSHDLLNKASSASSSNLSGRTNSAYSSKTHSPVVRSKSSYCLRYMGSSACIPDSDLLDLGSNSSLTKSNRLDPNFARIWDNYIYRQYFVMYLLKKKLIILYVTYRNVVYQNRLRPLPLIESPAGFKNIGQKDTK
jgi:hypothetical protein